MHTGGLLGGVHRGEQQREKGRKQDWVEVGVGVQCSHNSGLRRSHREAGMDFGVVPKRVTETRPSHHTRASHWTWATPGKGQDSGLFPGRLSCQRWATSHPAAGGRAGCPAGADLGSTSQHPRHKSKLSNQSVGGGRDLNCYLGLCVGFFFFFKHSIFLEHF